MTSLKFTPAWETAMLTCPGPGSGTATSATRGARVSGAGASKTRAHMRGGERSTTHPFDVRRMDAVVLPCVRRSSKEGGSSVSSTGTRRPRLVHPPVEDLTLVGVLNALADPTRLTIVRTLNAEAERACGSLPGAGGASAR